MSSELKKIVLFDMDGTLTPPRKPIEECMIPILASLLEHTRIGIVTGSGLDYINEQCSILWNASPLQRRLWNLPTIDPGRITLLPCNGTQRYEWDKEQGFWERVFNVSMKEELGLLTYKKLVRSILELQSKVANTNPELPLSGTFLQYRGSLLNWCMMGRDFSDGERNQFITMDEGSRLRKDLLQRLRRSLGRQKVREITMVLGGQCSIDIYPTGWDKTYALNHLNDYQKIWFLGDKCKEGGNDHLIYETLRPLGTSFEVGGPEDTIQVIREFVIPSMSGEKNE
jgi:phosphomannomutase